MHNLYGKRKLLPMEIKGSFTLSNGMYCVWGNPYDEGLSVDIYDSKDNKLLIGMEHGIQTTSTNGDVNVEMLISLMDSMLDDLEDSMVYYYGPKECTFKEEDLKKPFPKKTGRFS